MNGMDMLCASVMKAAGVDPDAVKTQIIDYGNRLSLKIASMDESLKRISEVQDAMRHQLEQLRAAHGLASDLMMQIAERIGAITSIEVALTKPNGKGGKDDGAATAKHRAAG